jgi:hypothetical protein
MGFVSQPERVAVCDFELGCKIPWIRVLHQIIKQGDHENCTNLPRIAVFVYKI